MPAKRNSKAVKLTALCPVLICADLSKSLAYFTKKLGFKVEFSYPDNKPIYAGVCRGSCSLHLSMTGKRPTSNKKAWVRGNRPADVCFFVSDVDRLYRELKRRGAKVASKPTTRPYGLRDIDVLTPDGQVLGFNQVLAPEE